MKQLLHNTPDGRHVILGIGDTVFYFSSCHGPESSSNSVRILTPVGSKPDNGSQSLSKEATVAVDPNEVQAVSVTVIDTIVWCAVARYDKSLTLYSIEATSEPASDELQMIPPTTTHRSSKRVCSLSFATVYGETPNQESLTVVVAGDLAGDAIAYSLRIRGPREPDRLDDDIVTQNRRLLLGHTASMLTCVQIVPEESSPRKQHILTSDRDEKIRISQFPNSHFIEGYLLGHTAFVSSIAVSPKTNRCVSVGGDHTLRLWDYTTFAELAVASTKTETIDRAGSILTVESKAPVDGEADQQQQHPVPSKVALNPDGNAILTVYDDCRYLDLWIIQQDEEKNSVMLEHCYRLECPAQPLAVSFLRDTEILVLMREPEYMQQFQLFFDEDNGTGAIKQASNPTYAATCSIRRWCSDRHIIMPVGLLEKDEFGCLKMGKMNERRSGATLKPWNNATRKETNAERVKRLRKRRRDQEIQSHAGSLDQAKQSINETSN
jgi:tRNA (guanine-N(7)-)-methyltransferase subunit TRM82